MPSVPWCFKADSSLFQTAYNQKADAGKTTEWEKLEVEMGKMAYETEGEDGEDGVRNWK